jgi:hypothetical protein
LFRRRNYDPYVPDDIENKILEEDYTINEESEQSLEIEPYHFRDEENIKHFMDMIMYSVYILIFIMTGTISGIIYFIL